MIDRSTKLIVCAWCSQTVPEHEALECRECGKLGCGGCVRLGNPYYPQGFFCPVDNELSYWKRKERKR